MNRRLAPLPNVIALFIVPLDTFASDVDFARGVVFRIAVHRVPRIARGGEYIALKRPQSTIALVSASFAEVFLLILPRKRPVHLRLMTNIFRNVSGWETTVVVNFIVYHCQREY